MGVKAVLRFTFRTLNRLALFAFAITLPITIFPIIYGIAGGVNFHLWSHREIAKTTNSFLLEVARRNELISWNVPGALTIHEFLDQKEPFHIPTLSVFDWDKKLDLILPNEHSLDEASGIDKLGSLDGLVRRSTGLSLPNHYWVYVTSSPQWSANPWDSAFSSLLQHLYVKPLPLDTDIFYLDCSDAGFLCGVWGVKYPSLVYFEVEDKSLADLKSSNGHDDADHDWLRDMLTPELTYNYPDDALRPVTARIIELPLKGDEASKLLPRGTFPTQTLQLRTLILDLMPDDILAMWEDYIPIQQITRLYRDHFITLTERRETWWYRLNEADEWYTDYVLEPIFGKTFTRGDDGAMFEAQSIVFTITILLAELIRIPFRIGWSIYIWYFGLGWDGLPLGTHPLPYEWVDDENGAGGTNMWNNWMTEFDAWIARNVGAQENDRAGRAAVTGNADEWWLY